MNEQKLYPSKRASARNRPEIAEVVATAVKKSDLKRLVRLHDALTSNRAISYYAEMPDDELRNALQIVGDALTLLTPRPRKRRTPRVEKAPLPIDFSGIAETDLFDDLDRWPRRPYCTHDKEAGLRIRSFRRAVQMPYIQPNPPNRRSWAVFDIDHQDAENAWRRAGLPPPTWTTINSRNGHAHCAWGLRTPVLVAGMGARDAPLRYLASIESLMQERLGADPRYSGVITQNPGDLVWLTLRGPQMYYDLSELAAHLPGIETYIPKKKKHEEQAGLGRNVSLFDKLRSWAYSAIRPFWGGGLHGWNGWLSMCNSRAMVYNADFCSPLGGKEVWHLARSVAKWTWQHTTQEGFSDWQAAQGRKGGVASGKVRASASENKAASARLMRATGMTQAAIAQQMGVHVNSVANWLR